MIDVSLRIRRAIHLKDLTLLKRIIKNNPKCLQNPDFTDNGNTSLHLAAQLGLVEIAEFLIDAGHEDESISRNANWDTPLLIAVETSPAVATLLATRFPRCIPWKNKQGADALMLTSRTPHTPLLETLLTLSPPPTPFASLPLHRPPSSTSTTYNIHSPLHATDAAGNTPLHYASAYGQLKCIRTLLEHGADAGARNAWSWTPVSYSLSVQAEVYFRNLVGAAEREREGGGSSVNVGSGGGRSRGGSGGKGGGVRLVGKEEEWGGEGFGVVMGERVRSGESAGVGLGLRSRAASGE